MKSFLSNNKRERPNRGGWGAAGTVWGGGANDRHCFHSAPLPLAGGSIPVLWPMLWPTCQITTASSQLHCPEPFTSEQREQTGTGHHHMNQVSQPGAAPARQTNAREPQAPAQAQPTSQNYLALKPIRRLLLHKKQEKDCIERLGSHGSSPGNAMGVEEQIVYGPLHLHKVGRGSIQVL